MPDAELTAVGSRSLERARAFARGARRSRAAYGSYEELLADESVDAVYVASPHALHVEHVTAALEAGKHVLCEKPVTLRAADAEALFALALRRERLLMEAMWTACHPVVRRCATRLRDGAFGTPRQLHAELGFVVDSGARGPAARPRARRGRPARHGHLPADLRPPPPRRGRGADGHRGALRDGLRPRHRRRGPLPRRRGRHDDRVDDLVVLAARRARHRPRPAGAGGLPPPTSRRSPPRRRRRNDSVEPVEPRDRGQRAVVGRGYAHEAIEFQRCLAEGLLESPLVPHAQTLTIMRQMDGLRAQVGVRYAGD